jgi:5-methylcytosine-specific restriction endonuclease McrA
MARKSIKPFYDSKEWKNVRNQKMLSVNYRCEECDGVAEEIHHIIELNESNISNPIVTLNTDNLVALCRVCHNKEHGRFKKSNIKFDKKGNIIKY